MADTKEKLDLDSISFDDMLGDGLNSISGETDTDIDTVEDEEEIEEEEEELEEEDSFEEEEEEEFEEEGEEEEEEEFEDDDTPSSVAGEIAKTLGFELENEYADTVEGLTEFARDLSQEMAEDQLQSLFEQFPEVQKHLDYVMSGGESEKFFEAYNPKTDYNNIEIAENDLGMQKAVLAQYLQLKGHEQEFIQEMLEDFEDSGKLYGKATQAKDALAQAQADYREQMLQQQEQENQRLLEEQAQFWDQVADTIESGNEFAGVRIPDKHKSRFFDYISEPVGPNGETQRDLDYAEAELEAKLAIDYLMYNGFNLSDIIDTKARTKSAQSLRDRIQSNQEKVKSARKARKSTKTFDPDDLDTTALF